MKNRLHLVLILLGSWAGTAGALTSISAYKTFTRELLTSADINSSFSTVITGVNNVIAKFPGDSVKVGTGAMDTLVANPGPAITLKNPLASVNYGDSIDVHRGRIDRLHVDSTFWGSTTVTPLFAKAASAGIRSRENLLSTDTLRVVDSLTIASVAKVLVLPNVRTVWSDGSSANIPRLATDSLYLGSGTIFNWNSGDATLTHSSNVLTLAGASSGYVFNDGNLYVNNTTNANMSQGVTISQGANDNQALVTQSSDVAHGLTSAGKTAAGTNDYLAVEKLNATVGGAFISAWRENDGGSGGALWFNAYGGTAATAAATGANAAVNVYFSPHNGSNALADLATSTLVFGVIGRVGSADRALFFVDAEGDLFADGSDVTVYDDYDDVALISTFDHHQAKISNRQLIESEWEDYQRYNEKDLIEAELIGGPRSGVDRKERGLVNYTGMVRLHNGAIRQVGREVNRLDSRTEELTEKVAYLEAVHGADPTWDDVELVIKKWLYNLLGRN